jgi:hypothetical protein
MAFAHFRPLYLGLSLLLLASAAGAQSLTGPAEGGAGTDRFDRQLTGECRVPASKVYRLGPLNRVRSALEEKRPIKILALGPPWSGSLRSASAAYQAELREELERVLPGIALELEERSLSGDVTPDEPDRFMNIVAEVQPDLVLWNVGINSALARVEVDQFTNFLSETLAWLRSHGLDILPIEPPYFTPIALDEHYGLLVAAIREAAVRNEAPVVMRFAAMRYLSQKEPEESRDQFRLHALSQRCLPKFVARTIELSIQAAAPPSAPSGGTAPATSEPGKQP